LNHSEREFDSGGATERNKEVQCSGSKNDPRSDTEEAKVEKPSFEKGSTILRSQTNSNEDRDRADDNQAHGDEQISYGGIMGYPLSEMRTSQDLSVIVKTIEAINNSNSVVTNCNKPIEIPTLRTIEHQVNVINSFIFSNNFNRDSPRE